MYTLVKDHNEFLLVDKHPGVDFHKGRGTEGLVDVIKKELGINGLFTVHRLDKVTSGLLIFAKNRESARELAYQFRNRMVEKYYLAVSDRSPKKKQGLIKGDMKKARGGAWKLTRSRTNPAITRFFSYAMGNGLRLFILRPYTGKTHQLRVAMKSIGAPVLGDPVYSKKQSSTEETDRCYLHSYALRFQLKGKAYEFIHKPDIGRHFTSESFAVALKQCERPWDLDWPVVK